MGIETAVSKERPRQLRYAIPVFGLHENHEEGVNKLTSQWWAVALTQKLVDIHSWDWRTCNRIQELRPDIITIDSVPGSDHSAWY